MDKKIWTILFLLLIILAPLTYYYLTTPKFPQIVNHYIWRYKQMNNKDYKSQLLSYCRNELKDPIDGLNYTELLEWEHRHLTYPNTDNYRPELPIDILKEGEGNCGEFSLLYTGLLLANNYSVRIVVDCSIKTDSRKAGDHVWVEVWIQERNAWVHVDPTDKIIDKPLYYENAGKNVNRVYALTDKEVVDVTERYQAK